MGALWQEFLEGSAVHFYDGEYRPRSTLMTYEEEKEGEKKACSKCRTYRFGHPLANTVHERPKITSSTS
jgi:predicted adenine nucleotide alpha hydrolase (AANH) superfamily ATPase